MARPQPIRVPRKNPTTLLCIDDQAEYLTVRKAVLEARGFEVVTATSGREGLGMLRKQKIDAAVLDYRMPEMDGGEVASEIRRGWPNLPIVLLSGFPYELPSRVRELVNAVVMKGGGTSELLHAIETLLPDITLRPRPPVVTPEAIQRTKEQIQAFKDATAERKRAFGRRRR